MSPTMRKKLERNVQYHAAMAEYHQEQLDAKKKKAAESHPPPAAGPAANTRSGSAKPTASAHPPKPDADEVLSKVHAEVVVQLQEILDKEPIVPAIVQAEANRPVRRNTSPDLKPSAGIFH